MTLSGWLEAADACEPSGLPDLLFAQHEGPPEQLKERQRWVWDHVLRPLLAATPQGTGLDPAAKLVET